MSYTGRGQVGTSRVFPAPDPNAPPIISTKIFSSSTIVEKMMLNCSGCTTLQDIVNLDLSNRRISTLDPAVFSRMSSLVDLNLTNNRLTGFPLSLGLRHLKRLNCNNNLLKSVQTLEQFPNVEELHIENNELTVADQYIAVYMLPKLKVLNGKEVDLRETILNMEETLHEQVHILWAESCAPLLKDPMSKAEIQMLEQQFIELLKNQVQFGPDALKDFTHHMLTVLAEKCVRQMTAHLRKIQEAGTPFSKVQIVVRNESGSSKSMSNGTVRPGVKSSVDKRQGQNSTSQEPASKKAKAAQVPGVKTKVPKTTAKRKMIEAQLKEEEGVVDAGVDHLQVVTGDVLIKEEVEEEEMEIEESQDSNQECGIAYEPVHLLRCHSVDNDPTDAKTNVWKCAFEPNPDVPGASKWTVATCGSNQVCVIDCNSGKVLKKYQHTKEKEEFYCIAWTKLGIITQTHRQPTTVLAAAGIRGSIKLLHTTQLLCYAEIKCGGRARPINCLLFHPKRPTWLFCGSEDITVIDIGIPHGPDLKIRHKKLFILEAPGRCLGLVICPKSNFLMAGCDNGCYGWSLDPPKGGGKREKEHSMEFLLPSKARLMGDEEEVMDDDGEKEGDMIDGLALIKDDLIASKVACDGSIHVWSLSHSRKHNKGEGKEVTINPLYTLEWCDSDSVYLDIGTWPGCGVLVSGDDQGEVWVYDVSKKSKGKSKKPVKPSQLLPWPENNEQELVEVKDEITEGKKEEQEAETGEQKAENDDATQALLQENANNDAQVEEIKDNAETEQVVAQAQTDADKDVEMVQAVETPENAVAQVLEDVVAKVVGDDVTEVTAVSGEAQEAAAAAAATAAATDNQVVGEKEEEKQEEKQEEDATQKEGVTEEKEGVTKEKEGVTKEKEGVTEEKEGVTEEKEGVTEEKEGVTQEVKDGEQGGKEGEGEQKENPEAAGQGERQEGEEEKAEVEETDKEKDTREDKEEDTTEEKEKDTAAEEQKEEKEEKAEEQVEGVVRRGRPRKAAAVEKAKEAESEKKDQGGAEKVRGRGRPKKVVPTEEEKVIATEEKKAETPIPRGRGRPRKETVATPPSAAQTVATPSSAAQTARARRDQKIAKQKDEKEKLKVEKEKQKAEKAEKKAQSLAAAAKAKEERAKEREEKAREKEEKAKERAKEKAELAELRLSLKKPKKGAGDLMDIANNEDRIIVNDVAISSDCKFIVSVTNKNLICVWQRV